LSNSIRELLGQTDIYLLDQIMKGRYSPGNTILDAGTGTGRNMHWFLQNDFDIYGTDISAEAINGLKKKYPGVRQTRFAVSPVEETNFTDAHFDHVICSAVLHFANSSSHFYKMMAELVRILKPGGSLFIRMTSDIGIENKVKFINDGVYFIPDGSKRFLLTKAILTECMQLNNLSLIEPLKTVNVDDVRCMSTLMFAKN